jgi:hypothetical protein
VQLPPVNRKSKRRRTQFTPENLRLLALAEAAGIQPAQLINQSLREYFRQIPHDTPDVPGQTETESKPPATKRKHTG